MAYTEPTTRTTGDLITASIWNTDLTDNISFLRTRPASSQETSSATPSINVDNVDLHRVTALAVNITSMTTNLSGTPRHGQKLVVEILDNGTSRTIAWGASFRSTLSATLPTATTISKLLRTGNMYDSADSIWECVGVTIEA